MYPGPITPTRWRAVIMKGPEYNPEEILTEALKIADPAERRAFLEVACAGSDALRQQVETMLAAYTAAMIQAQSSIGNSPNL
jgi:hypothetical protein